MSEQREEFLSDIIIGAIEGGTNYWAQVHQYQAIDSLDKGAVQIMFGRKHTSAEDTRATIRELDEFGVEFTGPFHEITYATVRKGLKLLIADESLPEGWRKRLREADRENDATNIDASDADDIVQMGLFGELRYA